MAELNNDSRRPKGGAPARQTAGADAASSMDAAARDSAAMNDPVPAPAEEAGVFRASELLNELGSAGFDEEPSGDEGLDPLGSLDTLMSNVDGPLVDFSDSIALDNLASHEFSNMGGASHPSAPDFPSLSFDGLEPSRAGLGTDDPFFTAPPQNSPIGKSPSPSGIFRSGDLGHMLQPKAGLDAVLADVLPAGGDYGSKSGSSIDGPPGSGPRSGSTGSVPVSPDAYDEGRDALGSSMSVNSPSKPMGAAGLGDMTPVPPPAPSSPNYAGEDRDGDDHMADILWTATVVDDGDAAAASYGGDAMEFPEIELDAPGATVVVQGRSDMLDELRAAAAARSAEQPAVPAFATADPASPATAKEEAPIAIDMHASPAAHEDVGREPSGGVPVAITAHEWDDAGNVMDEHVSVGAADESNILEGDFNDLKSQSGRGYSVLGESNVLSNTDDAGSPIGGSDDIETFHRGSIEMALENLDLLQPTSADASAGGDVDALAGDAPMPGETVLVAGAVTEDAGGLLSNVPISVGEGFTTIGEALAEGGDAAEGDAAEVLGGAQAFGNPDVLGGGPGSSLFMQMPTLVGRLDQNPFGEDVAISVNRANDPAGAPAAASKADAKTPAPQPASPAASAAWAPGSPAPKPSSSGSMWSPDEAGRAAAAAAEQRSAAAKAVAGTPPAGTFGPSVPPIELAGVLPTRGLGPRGAAAYDPAALERGVVEEVVAPVFGSDDSNELARLAASLQEGSEGSSVSSGQASSISRQVWDRTGLAARSVGSSVVAPGEAVQTFPPPAAPAPVPSADAAALPQYVYEEEPKAYTAGDVFLVVSCVVVFGLMGIMTVDLLRQAVYPGDDGQRWSLINWILRWLESR